MKIIDLINKIANGEDIPKNVKWGIHIFKLCEGTYINYYETIEFNGGKRYKTLEDYLDYDYKSLNEEVEILEEEKKIPEKWNDLSFTTMRKREDSIDDDIQKLKGYIETIMRTQNGVIDYLKIKGDE